MIEKSQYNQKHERGETLVSYVFMRQEQKYLLDERQCASLEAELDNRLAPDRYAVSKVCNIYYDTPDRRMIRRSLEKPVYKEKLRLRSYGDPQDDTTVYLELKKKYDGMVYKRRVALPHRQATAYMTDPQAQLDKGQIGREIDYAKHFYPGLQPSVYVSYDRRAWHDPDSDLRITVDRNILYRTTDLDLRCGSYGLPLLEPGQVLLEIKAEKAMPLWLSRLLSREKIRPVSYSKYGTAYRILQKQTMKEGFSHV